MMCGLKLNGFLKVSFQDTSVVFFPSFLFTAPFNFQIYLLIKGKKEKRKKRNFKKKKIYNLSNLKKKKQKQIYLYKE